VICVRACVCSDLCAGMCGQSLAAAKMCKSNGVRFKRASAKIQNSGMVPAPSSTHHILLPFVSPGPKGERIRIVPGVRDTVVIQAGVCSIACSADVFVGAAGP
jgi:hypothetical protein